MSEKCRTYNYADDTSICCRGDNFEMACREAEQCIEYMLNWFDVNNLKANPAKFQFIVFEKEFHPRAITVGNSMLSNQKCVKLLGINIDYELKFNGHILELCKKAGRKINVLTRLSTHLDIQSKLTLLYSFILSHFQYCSSVWFHCSDANVRKMEKSSKTSSAICIQRLQVDLWDCKWDISILS